MTWKIIFEDGSTQIVRYIDGSADEFRILSEKENLLKSPIKMIIRVEEDWDGNILD